MVDAYAARIADTPAAREALRVIIDRAIDDVAPDELPPGGGRRLRGAGPRVGPGRRRRGGRAGLRPRDRSTRRRSTAAVQEEEAVSFGDFGLGGLLALPRTLSFWKMKDRARRFGEGAGTTC